jgi:dihydroorotase
MMHDLRAVAGKRTAYINARLLDPATRLDTVGALLTDGSRIADFGPSLFADGVPEGISVVDCDGACLAPGLVDMRVQTGEPGLEHKETIATATAAAAAGGITSIVVLPNTDPVLDDVAGIEFVARRAREAKSVKVYAYGAVTSGLEGKEMAEIGLLKEAGAVGFTDGTHAVADTLVMARALNYARAFGGVIIQHPEEPRLAKGGAMNAGEISTKLGLSGISPLAEVMMIERDLRLVEMTGGRIHFAHISTYAAVEAIRAAKERGLAVTCDTAPPYFALIETDIGDYRTFFKLSPPLRRDFDRRAIVEAVADGTIDAIASDHNPEDQDAKRVPFAQAAFGAVGLETLLTISLEMVQNGHISLLDLIDRLTLRPASILGLPAGRLAKGAAADLVVFDAEVPWKVDAAKFRSKSKNCPFDERPVAGRALRTVVDGRTVYGG